MLPLAIQLLAALIFFLALKKQLQSQKQKQINTKIYKTYIYHNHISDFANASLEAAFWNDKIAQKIYLNQALKYQKNNPLNPLAKTVHQINFEKRNDKLQNLLQNIQQHNNAFANAIAYKIKQNLKNINLN
jgi:hypothetical protein